MTAAATLTPTEAAFRHALRWPQQSTPSGLQGARRAPAGRRFDVYRNNCAVALREALETGFPAVRSLIGPARFAAAATHFRAAHPPDDPRMALYGATFPEFLAGFEPLRGIGYLRDVARLEQALRESYHATDARPIPPASLQGLDEAALAALRLPVAPAVRVISSAWPVLSIRRFALEGGEKPPARAEDVLVTRPGFDPEPHLLPRGGAAFVTALASGKSFGTALGSAGSDFGLPETLSLLLAQGALAHPVRRGLP